MSLCQSCWRCYALACHRLDAPRMQPMADGTQLNSRAGQHSTYVQTLRQCRVIENDLIGDVCLTVAVGGNCNPAFLLPGLRLGLADEGIAVRIVETPYANWVATALAPEERIEFWVIWISALGYS